MPRLPTIAIGTASVAVLLSLIALVVVSTRAPNHSEEVGIVPFETPTAAADVMRLRETVELAKDESGAIGVRVIDEQLRALLGLQIADVIAGINGTPIKRERDVAEALSGARLANAMSLYVDVIREGEPVVELDHVDGVERHPVHARRRQHIDDDALSVESRESTAPLGSADQLESSALSVAKRLEIVGSEFPFVLSGGIFRAVPWLEEELSRRLPLASPRSQTILLNVEPATGAVRLALAEARGGYAIPVYRTD